MPTIAPVPVDFRMWFAARFPRVRSGSGQPEGMLHRATGQTVNGPAAVAST
jgi:hypothetical protein